MSIRALSVGDRRLVGMFAHSAVDHLWYQSPDCLPDDDDHRGCCPYCCAPCVALRTLDEAGDLDEWLRGWPEMLNGSAWWDADRQQVDRAWLARAWAQADEICGSDHAEWKTRPGGDSV